MGDLKRYGILVGRGKPYEEAIRTHGAEQGLSQVDISRHLIVTPANMTKLIDKLESDDMVRRYPMAGDRRVNLVCLTTKANALIDRIWEDYSQTMQNLMGKMPKNDKQIIASKLVQWLNDVIN